MERTFTKYTELQKQKKKKSPFLWLLSLLFTILTLIIITLIGAWLWVEHYIESDSFREFVSQKTSTALDIQGAYEPLDWTGASVFTNQFSGAGEHAIRRIEAQALRSELDIRAILEGVWRLKFIDIEHLDLELYPTPASGKKPSSFEPVATPPKHAWLPTKFEVRNTMITDGTIRWTSGRLEHAYIKITPDKNGLLSVLKGGNLFLNKWEPWKVDHIQMRKQEDAYYFTEINLHHKNGGVIEGTGELNTDTASSFFIKYREIPTDLLLDESLRRKLNGTLQGEITLNRKTINDPWLANGTIQMKDGVLHETPLLSKLAEFSKLIQLKNPILQNTKIDFKQTKNQIEIEHFETESEGLFRVEGSAIIKNGYIDGTFELGFTSGSLQWIPVAENTIFTTSRGAYLWTTVKVYGPLENPQNDLEERLTNALGEAVLGTATDTIKVGTGVIKTGVQSVLDTILSP